MLSTGGRQTDRQAKGQTNKQLNVEKEEGYMLNLFLKYTSVNNILFVCNIEKPYMYICLCETPYGAAVFK